MNRRRFITCTLGTAGLAGLGWKAFGNSGLKHATLSKGALGSKVYITVYSKSRSQCEDAIEAAFDAIDRVETVMSLYRSNSQLCRLNDVGTLEDPDPDLIEVLKAATHLSQRTDGAFDVTVQPLWNLYAGHTKRGTLPSPEEIAQARRHIGWKKLHIVPHGIWLEDGAEITLNGIAQGYAVDKARATLIEHGIEHAILDTGEVGTLGTNVERGHWAIGIKHPRQDGLLGVTQLDDRCMATSGDYETRFIGDSHHLFDPQTGHSAKHCASVSVVAPSGMQADALSTACFVLGVERGMEFIREQPGADALFVAKDGRITRSEGFPVKLS